MTSPQLYFEDTEVGAELPTLEKTSTTRQLVMYAGASGDFHEFHYDLEFAQAHGLPNIIVQGALKKAFLGQLLTDCTGPGGTLKKLTVRYSGMDMPGRPLYCKGVVTKKHTVDGERLVECDVWTENDEGEKTTTGSAVVALPSR